MLDFCIAPLCLDVVTSQGFGWVPKVPRDNHGELQPHSVALFSDCLCVSELSVSPLIIILLLTSVEDANNRSKENTSLGNYGALIKYIHTKITA